MAKQRVGIIGGGQLAWMLAQEAPKLGLTVIVQTPQGDDPAVRSAQGSVFAAIASAQGTAQLAQQCDVITFENEFVDLAALQNLADQGVEFCPSLAALAPLLNKYDQRCYLQSLGLPVPTFQRYQPETPLPFDYPFVLKACRHGYDGQGTQIIHSAQGLKDLAPSLAGQPWLMEAYIPFERELAVMAARNAQGEIVVYPVTETYQQNQVCQWTITPAAIALDLQAKAADYARQLLTALDFVGIMGIEYFLTPAGDLLINEIAPRTHNSGHYTLDACATSQFAMQLQAVTGQPLGSLELICSQAIMVNLLGYESTQSEYADQRQQLATLPHTQVHWYEKQVIRPGRKLGHVTVLIPGEQLLPESDLKAIIQEINQIWYPQGHFERT
ncbi:MAG: 5-(carboxyamino)imidazole ribonucleotide synthase [Merismopediaceae bacterium]|nr:5-(carboxyamino)imidazole ribonucleotide synthase [Merismopediaceae bacterium]